MSNKTINGREEVHNELIKFISRHGGISKARTLCDVSYNFLYDMSTGRKPISAKVLKVLGYEKIITVSYVKKGEPLH